MSELGAKGVPDVDVYLFGSALVSLYPRDLDLLVVYDPHTCGLSDALAARASISLAAQERLGALADISLLSKREAAESNFVEEEGCQLVW